MEHRLWLLLLLAFQIEREHTPNGLRADLVSIKDNQSCTAVPLMYEALFYASVTTNRQRLIVYFQQQSQVLLQQEYQQIQHQPKQALSRHQHRLCRTWRGFTGHIRRSSVKANLMVSGLIPPI